MFYLEFQFIVINTIFKIDTLSNKFILSIEFFYKSIVLFPILDNAT